MFKPVQGRVPIASSPRRTSSCISSGPNRRLKCQFSSLWLSQRPWHWYILFHRPMAERQYVRDAGDDVSFGVSYIPTQSETPHMAKAGSRTAHQAAAQPLPPERDSPTRPVEAAGGAAASVGLLTPFKQYTPRPSSARGQGMPSQRLGLAGELSDSSRVRFWWSSSALKD